MSYLWAKSRSWHLTPEVLPAQRSPGKIKALCGKYVPDNQARLTEPDPEDRTCERCFQIREGRT